MRPRHALRARAAIAAAMVALAAAATAPSAGAQALPPIDYSQFDVLISTLGNASLPAGSTGSTKPSPSRPKGPTARQRATLRFHRSAKVTQSLYQRVIANADPGADPAALTGQMDAAKASFRKVLTKTVGWRSYDVGDVAAFSLLQAYALVAQHARLSSRGMAAVRRDVRDNLAGQAKIRRLSDARQQEIAEVFELRVIFFIDAVNDAARAQDPAAAATARDRLREWADDTFGLDVTKVKLTARGLVRR